MKQGYRAIVMTIVHGLVLAVPLAAQSAKFDEFPNTRRKAGEIAPDFTLQTLEGESFTLSEAYAARPVVIEFGSYT